MPPMRVVLPLPSGTTIQISGTSAEDVLGDLELEVLGVPALAVVEDEVARVGAEVVDGERPERLGERFQG
jgi:hypothetical protein